jgi:hypothetical protein
MPNHFEAIGFVVRDEDELAVLAARAIEGGERIAVPGGDYYCWAPGGGPEVWVQVAGGKVIGLTPHFAGSTALRAGIVGRVLLPEDTALEGNLHAWANPLPDGAPDTGDYPFVFAVPDYRALDRMRVPAAARVRITAFAHELDVHASEEAYLAAQQTELKFAAESFIPSGMFGEDAEAPAPLALINATVLAAERRTNPAGGTYWWMHLRTLGGEVDAVAEEALVTQAPVTGGIVGGSFYLSGRVELERLPARRRWWQRLAGR